jgi:hypothetical protein
MASSYEFRVVRFGISPVSIEASHSTRVCTGFGIAASTAVSLGLQYNISSIITPLRDRSPKGIVRVLASTWGSAVLIYLALGLAGAIFFGMLSSGFDSALWLLSQLNTKLGSKAEAIVTENWTFYSGRWDLPPGAKAPVWALIIRLAIQFLPSLCHFPIFSCPNISDLSTLSQLSTC